MHGHHFGENAASTRGQLAWHARETRSYAFRFALIALLIAQLSLFVHPAGFEGGPSDDQRYLDVALDWYRNGSSAGTTHWALRVPLIGTIDALFHIFGPTITALLAVPRLFYALFIVTSSAAMARWAGRHAAWAWLILVIVSPVLHQMATSCYPEIVELALGTLSLVAFIAARRKPHLARRHGLLALSGLALGIGIIARETIAFLAIGYAWVALFRPAMRRRDYATFAVALLLPILANIGWLWSLTGDPLYRLHVGENHLHIYSAHLRGGIYTGGGPFLNPDLASRWIPAGPTRLFWPLNPIGDFFIDPAFGFILPACALIALPFVRRGQKLAFPRGAAVMLAVIAIGCYLTVTWIFTLRPQPRYYLPVIAAAQVALALGLGAMIARPDLRRRALTILAVLVVGGTIPILVARDRGLLERQAIVYMVAHPGVYAAPDEIASRLTYRAELAGVAPPLTGNPPPGGYRISAMSNKIVERNGGTMPPPPPGYRHVALQRLDKPLIETLFRPNRWRAMRVEQRER